MDDPLFVGRFERLRDLPRDRQRLINRNRLVRETIGERRSLDQLQDEGLQCGLPRAWRGDRFFKAVNRGDVRMIERGQDLRFALEACEPVDIEGEELGQNLQRDVAIELGVACAIDLAHPTRTKRAEDFVRAESSAAGKTHGNSG